MNFSGKDLRERSLQDAYLEDADFSNADLRDADFRRAYLKGVNFRGANLRGVNFRGVNLSYADLSETDLRGADLRGADLPEKTFVIYGEVYEIFITNGKYLRAGCQNHRIDEWRKFSKAEIFNMGGALALRFYPRLLDILDFYTGKGERPGWI